LRQYPLCGESDTCPQERAMRKLPGSEENPQLGPLILDTVQQEDARLRQDGLR
jgi:hypothetical protein